MGASQQLRQARALLSWSLDQASQRSGLSTSVIERAETGEGAPDITLADLARLSAALEAAGIRIGPDGAVMLDQSA